MKPVVPKPQRCAIYTRKSTEHNLDLEFNSLDAQREACEAYIKSQEHEGWRLVPDRYNDGGLSGSHDSIEAMSGRLGMNKGRLTSLVRLSYLGPEIVRALLAGSQSNALTPSRLLRLSKD